MLGLFVPGDGGQPENAVRDISVLLQERFIEIFETSKLPRVARFQPRAFAVYVHAIVQNQVKHGGQVAGGYPFGPVMLGS